MQPTPMLRLRRTDLQISHDGKELIDCKTGRAINEFGATRFDVAVHALRGDFDPPPFVEVWSTLHCSALMQHARALQMGAVSASFPIVQPMIRAEHRAQREPAGGRAEAVSPGLHLQCCLQGRPGSCRNSAAGQDVPSPCTPIASCRRCTTLFWHADGRTKKRC